MPRIELQQLIRPTTTPEQEILLSHFYNQFDNRSAANRNIVNVEPLYFQGAIGGTEFLVYAATKLYICYDFKNNDSLINAITPFINFRDENNVNFSSVRNIIYDAATAYLANKWEMKNFYFSCAVVQLSSFITFCGYRITLI